MEWLTEFAGWAWARHHNMLSWYIRPLFLIPFVFFAYRRNPWGLIGTLVALASSMFWFPAPTLVNPRVAGFLAMEREYLLGEWTAWKVLVSLTVPLSLWALAAAFWHRSFTWGLVVINAMALGKILWSFVFGEAADAMMLLWPALIGMLLCDVIVLAAWRRLRPRSTAATTLTA